MSSAVCVTSAIDIRPFSISGKQTIGVRDCRTIKLYGVRTHVERGSTEQLKLNWLWRS